MIASEIELVPANCLEPLDLPAIFGRVAPLEVDLGCGDGSFLSALAAQNPDNDFLGIERLLGRVHSACRRIERAGLTNARVTRFEISYAVAYLLPPGSITAFYLLFPDPWPKRRHQFRRIFTHAFLDAIAVTLEKHGVLRVATDQLDYFHQIERLSRTHSSFEVVESHDLVLPLTKFERKFREQGSPIYRLTLRKTSPVR